MEEGESSEELPDLDDDAPFAYPSPATTTSPPAPLKLNAEAPSFTFPSTSVNSAPISMPRASASSLSRERTSSTSALNEGHLGDIHANLPLHYGVSVTPRGGTSPFAHFSASDLSASPDLSTTPSASHRPPHLQTKTTAKSVGTTGYDPAVLKTLITGACASGDLERLKALLSGGDGSDEFPSVFALANRASQHTALTPLHLAAARGHIEASYTENVIKATL